MRLDVLMPLVSGILSYDQKMKGKRPIYWKNVFQYFVNASSYLVALETPAGRRRDVRVPSLFASFSRDEKLICFNR